MNYDNNIIDDNDLQSLFNSDSFDFNKMNLYYVDTKDNYESGSTREKVYSSNSYNELINSINDENNGIVKANISNDAKICIFDGEITEEVISQKKAEGYDIIAYKVNGKNEYIILNDEVIEEKIYLTKNEALKDLEAENAKQQLLSMLLSNSTEDKKSSSGQKPHITQEMKDAQNQITSNMQMLGLLDVDEEVGYSQLNQANKTVNDAKIDIDSGYLRYSIELLDILLETNMPQLNDYLDTLESINSLELDCDVSFINNYFGHIQDLYTASDLEIGGLIASYSSRLKKLRNHLNEMNPNYVYSESSSYLLNLAEFANDLGWSEEEMAKAATEVGNKAKADLMFQLDDDIVVKPNKKPHGPQVYMETGQEKNMEVLAMIGDIDKLVKYNNNFSSAIAYKVANDEELTESENTFYSQNRENEEFIDLLDVYQESRFREAIYRVSLGEADEKDKEIYNSKEYQEKYSDVYTSYISSNYSNILNKPEEERTEEEKIFLSQNESEIIKWGNDIWKKYDLDNVGNSNGFISDDVSNILFNRSSSLKERLDNNNIKYLFGPRVVVKSSYDLMSDSELNVISVFSTIMMDKTVEGMQPALKREDERARLGAYKEVKQYWYDEFRGYMSGTITDENGNEITGFYGETLPETTKEFLFSDRLNNEEWATDMWRGYYYTGNLGKSYYVNAKVLGRSDLYDRPSTSEFDSLLNKEEELIKSEKADKEYIKLSNKNYLKYKEAFFDSKATLIIRYPSDNKDIRAAEEDFLLQRDQFKISLETEKLGNQVNENNNKLEQINSKWDYAFDKLEKELKKYAKKLGYNVNSLTTSDYENLLEKYLDDADIKTIKTSKKTTIDNTEDNRKLLLSAYKERNKLNKEQLKISDTIASLQDVNLALYTLYSDYDENKTSRISNIDVESTNAWGNNIVKAYDSNGQLIDVTMAEIAVYCEEHDDSEVKKGIFGGPELYALTTQGYVVPVGKSSDVYDVVTGIGYFDNKKERFDLLSYLGQMDAKTGTSYSTPAALEMADMGKRVEGARLAKKRQEKVDKASKIIGNIVTGAYSDIEIDGTSLSNYVGQFITTAGVGIYDGFVQFGTGLYCALGGADGKVSAEDYARMYYAQELKENYGSFYQDTYEICTSIGNMLPTVALTALATALTIATDGATAGVLAKVLSISATTLMGISAGGNSVEQGLQEGMTVAQALLYGTLSGASEAVLEKLLGGIPGLSDVPNLGAKLLSKLGGEPMQKFLASAGGKLIHEMASEAFEEGLQEILDPVFKVLVGKEWEGVDWKAVGKSALFGALTAGIMQGSGTVVNSGVSLATTGTTSGLTVALSQTLSQNKGGLLNNFDYFQNCVTAIKEHKSSLPAIKANLSTDANVKSQYEQYKKIYMENQSSLEEVQFMSFDQYVENLAVNSIIGLHASEGNINILKGQIEPLNKELNDIENRLKEETDSKEKTKLEKRKSEISDNLKLIDIQIKQCEMFLSLDNNYFAAASFYSNNILNSMKGTKSNSTQMDTETLDEMKKLFSDEFIEKINELVHAQENVSTDTETTEQTQADASGSQISSDSSRIELNQNYSDYKLEQLQKVSGFDEISKTLLKLAPDAQTKAKMESILYNGGYENFKLSSDLMNKDNAMLDGWRRISMASLLLTNPETFDYFVKNGINLFHGTRGIALPSILANGLYSLYDLQQQNIEVKTGEAWSMIKNNSRDFISFTDILDLANAYSVSSNNSDSNLDFRVLVCTTSEIAKNLPTSKIGSDTPEIGINNKLAKENIKAICVPSDKVELVRSMLTDSSIEILPLDFVDRFYFADNDSGDFLFDSNGITEFQKAIDNKKSSDLEVLDFENDESNPLPNGMNLQLFAERKTNQSQQKNSNENLKQVSNLEEFIEKNNEFLLAQENGTLSARYNNATQQSLNDMEYAIKQIITKYGYSRTEALRQIAATINEQSYRYVTSYGGARDIIKRYNFYELAETYNLLISLDSVTVNDINTVEYAIKQIMQRFNYNRAQAIYQIEILIKTGNYAYMTSQGGARNLLQQYSIEKLDSILSKIKVNEFSDIYGVKNIQVVASNIFDNYFKNNQNIYNSTYGVDQGAIYSLCTFTDSYGNEYTYRQAKEIVNKAIQSGHQIPRFIKTGNEEYFALKNKLISKYGLSSTEASVILSTVDDSGACSYAATCNEIISAFHLKPDLFEKAFGFPMYKNIAGKVIPNYNELLVDMYVYMNMEENGGNFLTKHGDRYFLNKSARSNKVDPLGRTLLDSQNQIYLSGSYGKNQSMINSYLNSKGLKYSSQKIFDRNQSVDVTIMNKLIKRVTTGITSGYEYSLGIYAGAKEIRLISTNQSKYNSTSTFNWSEGGGHAVFVTGINESGFIVSSWGEEYIIPFEDLLQDGAPWVLNESCIGY